jgi:hypothetical protein
LPLSSPHDDSDWLDVVFWTVKAFASDRITEESSILRDRYASSP